ncbi:YggT family protein [Peptostreptococcus faecalis]|uniref:YggT family protein n=1 Tax=Peptostreptococcus faecalis TaxID=2045015 RepID=UPI000C796A7F|nr:YggT family protein [Peptostreptococcus faecalis]
MYILKIALVYLITIIMWAIIAKSLMSWFPGAQDSRVYAFLEDFTLPVERPIRNIFGRYMTGPLDFTPMISFIALIIIRNLIERFL